MTQAPRFSSGTKSRSRSLGAGVDDFDRVAAGANDVAERLDLGAAIDIGDGVKIGIGGLQRLEFRRRAAFLQRTAGVLVRQNDGLAGIEDFGRFGHEMDAAKNDDLGPGFGRLLGKAEGIAHVIGHVLDFRHLVIVGQDDGVQAVFELENIARQGVQPLRRQRNPRDKFRLARWLNFNHLGSVPARYVSGQPLLRLDVFHMYCPTIGQYSPPSISLAMGFRHVCFSRLGSLKSSVKRPCFFSYLARRSQTEESLVSFFEIGPIIIKGFPRRVTTIASRLAATCSQISENFVFASNRPISFNALNLPVN